MENITKIDELLNPEDVFMEYKNKLIDRYVEDYGEEYQSLIKNRLNETTYLFESNPMDNMLFLDKNLGHISSAKKINEMYKEYKNYFREKKRLDEAFDNATIKLIGDIFNCNCQFSQELLKLDFDSYSSVNQEAVIDDNLSEVVKNNILDRQLNYLNNCKELGIVPVTDGQIVDKLNHKINILKNKKNEFLISSTLWGNKIKTILNSSDTFTDSEIANIVFNEKMSASTNIVCSPSKNRKLCYIPIVKLNKLGPIDRIFFHENRHVIETDSNYCGIDVLDVHEYKLINEIRTEKNAICDLEKFSDTPLFSNENYKDKYNCTYTIAFPYTDDFFEINRDFLNFVSLNHDLDSLEERFGRNYLISFNNYIENILRDFSVNYNSDLSNDKIVYGKELIKKMNCSSIKK